MKLTIAIVVASILIISQADYTDGTFLPWPPVTCEPPTTTKRPKPTTKTTQPPTKTTKKPKPTTRPPTRPTRPPTPTPTRPPTPTPTIHPTPTPTPTPTKPTPKPCGCQGCGPGGVACQGCQGRDGLCKELLDLIRDLDRKIRQCVCGQTIF